MLKVARAAPVEGEGIVITDNAPRRGFVKAPPAPTKGAQIERPTPVDEPPSEVEDSPPAS
jgi:hypothetical protein